MRRARVCGAQDEEAERSTSGSGGENGGHARQERLATDTGQPRLTEEFDDGRHDVERTGYTMLAGGNIVGDDIKEAIFAGVASCSQVRKRTDVAETWMRKAERSALPHDVDVRFIGTDVVRVLLWTVDLGDDGLTVEEIAALGDNFTNLLTSLRIF